MAQAQNGTAKGKRPGRPRLETPVQRIHLTLSLRVGEDDDLLAFFASHLPRQRARAVMVALRQGGVGAEIVTHVEINEAELLAALDDLLF
jgi:hypothetical protein